MPKEIGTKIKLHADEYAAILQMRSARVAEILKSEGFSSGMKFPEETVKSATTDLQDILDEIKLKQKK